MPLLPLGVVLAVMVIVVVAVVAFGCIFFMSGRQHERERLRALIAESQAERWSASVSRLAISLESGKLPSSEAYELSALRRSSTRAKGDYE